LAVRRSDGPISPIVAAIAAPPTANVITHAITAARAGRRAHPVRCSQAFTGG